MNWKNLSGIGLWIGMIFLVIAVYSISCMRWGVSEGFKTTNVPKPGDTEWVHPSIVTPRVGPTPEGVVEGAPLSGPGELPIAPNSEIDASPVPFQDPASMKASKAQIDALVEDMKAFNGFELPYLQDRGDPNIQMPISTFRAQFQDALDESNALNQNPGLASHITLSQLDRMRSNLRYLQKTYRQLNANGVFGPGGAVHKNESGVKEGFETTSERATLSDLKILQDRLDAEITRLGKSGTTDPVIVARMNIFTELRQKIDSILTDVTNGTMNATEIPIYKEDIVNFLPALTESSNATDLSEYSDSFIETIQHSLFGLFSFSNMDGSGSVPYTLNSTQAEAIADKILKGLSFDIRMKYTGENELELAKTYASMVNTVSNGIFAGTNETPILSYIDEQPTAEGLIDRKRGEFDIEIGSMETTNVRPQNREIKVGKLDWKARAADICENVRKAGLDPGEYGCLKSTQDVGPNYSWRGHARMICTRLETNALPGTSESMGCPPTTWKGWRS